MNTELSICEYVQEKHPSDADFVEYLDKFIKEFDVNIQEPNRGNSILILCANRKMVESVKYLLSKGANPNIPNVFNVTPLHWACQDNQIEMVDSLLAHKANYNIITSTGSLAIHMAINAGSKEIVMKLLNKMAEEKDYDSIKNVLVHIEENRASILSKHMQYKYNDEMKMSLPYMEKYLHDLLLNIKLKESMPVNNIKEIKKI